METATTTNFISSSGKGVPMDRRLVASVALVVLVLAVASIAIATDTFSKEQPQEPTTWFRNASGQNC